jgi:chemotaxis protein MotB
MKKVLLATILIGSAFAFPSCVSSKKFKASEAKVDSLTTELTSTKSALASQTANLNAANAKIGDLNSQVSSLTAQNAALAPDAARYLKLKAEHQAEIDALNEKLAEKGTNIDEVQQKVIEGFSQLADSGIAVTLQHGFLYVDLPERLLFKEGSAKLGVDSKKALSPLASVLNNYPRVQIYVIGNTDTANIHNATFADNWSLSTERANSVVRVFRDTYHIDPARLLAAGKSKYAPIASNATKAGRAQNRRIQLIIDPNLRGIWAEAVLEQ